MKRMLSIVLAAAMTVGMAALAFAEKVEGCSISLSADTTRRIGLDGSLLTPGETYRFPILVSVGGGELQPLDDTLINQYSVKVTNTGEGETMSEFAVIRVGGNYHISAKVKAGWPAVKTEEEYAIRMTNKKNRQDFAVLNVTFETGYEQASDENISQLEEGDEVVVDNTAPVYDADQLERISKRNGYKKVTFSDDGWRFTVNVNDMDAVNLVHNRNAVKEIVTKYEDHSFEFLTFPAGPRFRSSGLVEIDVSDYAEDFDGQFFLYRYLHGELTEIPVKYNSGEETLTFSTDTLGRFVITDQPITDRIVFTPSV